MGEELSSTQMPKGEERIRLHRAVSSGDFHEALKVADQILSLNPQDQYAILVKARILCLPDPTVCDYAKAITLVQIALNADESNIQRWCDLAEIQKLER